MKFSSSSLPYLLPILLLLSIPFISQIVYIIPVLLLTIATVVMFLVLLSVIYKYPYTLLFSMIDLLVLLLTLKLKTKEAQKTENNWNIVLEWKKRVALTPSNPFITMVDTNQSTTFNQSDNQSDKVAHCVSKILKSYSVCAVLMPSCIEYVELWLGLAKCQVTAALINTNLSNQPLQYAIELALEEESVKILIVDDGLYKKMSSEVIDYFQLKGIKIYIHTTDRKQVVLPPNTLSFTSLLLTSQSSPYLPPQNTNSTPGWSRILFYISTSGTTGLPKASKINHLRFYSSGLLLSNLCHTSPASIIYCSLPLYHSAGGMIGVSSCIISGSSLVIRPKFSVGKLAEDIVKYKITVLQYIGEFARFTLAKPSSPEQRVVEGRCKETLKYAFGNGLSPSIWLQFKEKFGISRVVEFYGSTEGNANLVNNSGVPGAIGVVPSLLSFIYPVCLVKCDEDGCIMRDENGRGIVTKPGEVGQLLGLINETDPARRFDGYTNVEATEAKITTDVVKKGDKWFMTGDLMKCDGFGFYYWVDRMGDTFRWRGENVSTSEVEGGFTFTNDEDDNGNDDDEVEGTGTGTNQTNLKSCIDDVNVYGVHVPHNDGKAGMARIKVSAKRMDGFDFRNLERRLIRNLPGYAVPIFLRVFLESGANVGADGEDEQNDDSMTGTFKHKKVNFALEGFDVKLIRSKGEEVFVRVKGQGYVVLGENGEDEIKRGAGKWV